MKPKLVTAAELAERYDVHVKTIYKWTYRKILPVVKLGAGCVRFDVEKCDRVLKWTPASPNQSTPGDKPPTPRLVAAKELAEYYAVHPKTIHKWTRLKIIPVVKISRNCVRFDMEKCNLALEKRTRKSI